MNCKKCSSCKKGFFKSQPDAYVCIGVKNPFIIKDINAPCTEYGSTKKASDTKELINAAFFPTTTKEAELLDIIDKQAAEIEEQDQAILNALRYMSSVKVEAYKEFAKDLKAIYEKDKRYDRPNAHTLIEQLFYNIDKLVEEKVGIDS